MERLTFFTCAYDQPADFAFRIGSWTEASFVYGNEMHHAAEEVGPRAPDEFYARMGWRTFIHGGYQQAGARDHDVF